MVPSILSIFKRSNSARSFEHTPRSSRRPTARIRIHHPSPYLGTPDAAHRSIEGHSSISSLDGNADYFVNSWGQGEEIVGDNGGAGGGMRRAESSGVQITVRNLGSEASFTFYGGDGGEAYGTIVEYDRHDNVDHDHDIHNAAQDITHGQTESLRKNNFVGVGRKLSVSLRRGVRRFSAEFARTIERALRKGSGTQEVRRVREEVRDWNKDAGMLGLPEFERIRWDSDVQVTAGVPVGLGINMGGGEGESGDVEGLGVPMYRVEAHEGGVIV
ncbi:hypothetical protein EJ08DRAFT_155976 [Tothia fuscella]|uniref:Uncharacterized protein n=1 Tax=Tothia fuscella TaxID=1048955 RepID=A0A9P4P4W4_9PEZI|nr:hypothetical protein EJ08DRAFT_155976 [Tothia fuscella]